MHPCISRTVGYSLCEINVIWDNVIKLSHFSWDFVVRGWRMGDAGEKWK